MPRVQNREVRSVYGEPPEEGRLCAKQPFLAPKAQRVWVRANQHDQVFPPTDLPARSFAWRAYGLPSPEIQPEATVRCLRLHPSIHHRRSCGCLKSVVLLSYVSQFARQT
jgi:hypothetical protein